MKIYNYNAAKTKDVNALKHILDTVNAKSEGRIPSARVIEEIYFIAVCRDFSPQDMDKLMALIPIEIDRPIRHVFQGMCNPPELETDSLLNLAVTFHRPDLVDWALNKGADVNHLSHEGETPRQELERILEEDRKASQPYNLEIKERMLDSINGFRRLKLT